MGKLLVCWLLLCGLSLLAGCREEEKGQAGAPREELVYASTKDIRDINPHLYGGEMAAQGMVFEPLVINTAEGVRPWLAESWEISPDGRVYTFHLRRGVTFSDGTPFDAEAVRLNMDAIIANRLRHAWLDMINEIERHEVVDSHTWRLVLKHAYYPTLIELGLLRPFRFISPSCFIDGQTRNGVRGLVGTGPWVLKEHKENQYALFTANPSYWGEKPRLQAVRWKVMPDHQAILLALQYAVDREGIAATILNGSETVAPSLLASTVAYCDLPLEARGHDPEKAARLLDGAGWLMAADGWRYKDGRRASVRLYYNSQNAQERSIGEYMQADLKKIGVEMKIVGEEKQAFLDRQKSGDFELQYSLSWGTPYDPQSYISSWRIPAHGDYQAQLGLERKEWLDAAITRLMTETDEERRKALYAEILGYVHDEGVYIPLTYSRTKAVHVRELKGVSFGVSQYEIPFEKMYF